MQSVNQVAFKEWAVICEALGAGRQSLILRKGGIHEGRAGFRVEHPEFWLFPTNFHQAVDDLSSDYRDLWEVVRQNLPTAAAIPLRFYAVVEQTMEIADANILPKLQGLHGWSEGVIRERFHYKRPGLFALFVRIFELPDVILVENSPQFAGCRSWVELPDALPTTRLRPVLSDAAHAARREAFQERISPQIRG
jgi:hypothetical protein